MLEGLGEPLEQAREIAADIRYRARQERIGGELQLLDEALTLGRRLGALSGEEASTIARHKLAELLPQIAPEPRRPLLRRPPSAPLPKLPAPPEDADDRVR